jgi:hypothetical protein
MFRVASLAGVWTKSYQKARPHGAPLRKGLGTEATSRSSVNCWRRVGARIYYCGSTARGGAAAAAGPFLDLAVGDRLMLMTSILPRGEENSSHDLCLASYPVFLPRRARARPSAGSSILHDGSTRELGGSVLGRVPNTKAGGGGPRVAVLSHDDIAGHDTGPSRPHVPTREEREEWRRRRPLPFDGIRAEVRRAENQNVPSPASTDGSAKGQASESLHRTPVRRRSKVSPF